MENTLGFAHFLANADGVARFILVLMALMSIGTWYLIVTKGARLWLAQREGAAFLYDFWQAASLDAVARQLREKGVTDAFSHLVHHGFTAIEQYRTGKEPNEMQRGLIDAGTPDEFITRALKRAIAQDKSRMEYGQTFLATVASSAPFVGLFGTVWGIYHALMAIGMSGQGTLDKVAGPVGEDELTLHLKEAARREPQPELHLRAERTTPYEKVAEVMSAAARAGVSRIGFVTEPHPTR